MARLYGLCRFLGLAGPRGARGMSRLFVGPNDAIPCACAHASCLVLLAAGCLSAAGCTGPIEYVRNGFKVGPNYGRPPAPVADNWIDADDRQVQRDGDKDRLADWWSEFHDPTLDALIQQSYRENLTLREAGFRILAARAQLGFAVGDYFPQLQTANGAYTRFGVGNSFFDRWNSGFNLAWELDFWGRFRRAIVSAEATLDASVEDYDAVLVTLLGDVASNYVVYRTTEERIRLLENIVSVQEDVLKFINQQLDLGAKSVTEVDRAQASSDLSQSLRSARSAGTPIASGAEHALHPAGHAGDRPVGDLGQGAEDDDPDDAGLRRGGHPGRLVAAEAGRAAGRASGGGAGRGDRHRRGGSVSGDIRSAARSVGRRRSSATCSRANRSTAT